MSSGPGQTHPVFNAFEVSKPWDFREIFARDGPVELEIGFGRGDFLVQRAQQRPEVNLLGLEVSSVSVRKAAKTVSRLGLNNVRLAKIEASIGLFYFVAEKSISKTWVMFPDPWPKKKHTSRRLMDRAFLRLLANRTADQGSLFLITDWPDYARWVEQQARACPWFKYEAVEPELPRTKYALKWLSLDRRFFGFSFEKIRHPAGPGQMFPKEVDMSQFVVQQVPDLNRVVKGFEAFEQPRVDGVIKVQEAYCSSNGKTALFACLSSERGLVQRFWVSAQIKQDKTVIKVAEHSYTVSTPGVSACVRVVRDMVFEKG